LNADAFPGPARGRPGSPPSRLGLRLPYALRETLIAHCLAALPDEGCGLLIGSRDGASARIEEAIPARNVLASPRRYEIAPEAVLAADRAARAAGRVLLGAWHSHPGGRAVPSAQDRDEAWPDWCYLIVGLADADRPELRAWRLLGEDFVEDELEIA
jgi:proteasome lid subunit RPN8/RPN11